jgi:8-hydroxy-5-deazaflavin:NADPH oxidoreductase
MCRWMRITVIGRGNVGGGLAKLWRAAGHEVDELGKDGGDASGADVLFLAVPAAAVADALGKVSGIEGKVTIDATNRIRTPPPDGFDSLAAQVKSITGGPTAKAFNLNFARVYDEIGNQSVTPGNLYCADDEAREVTEQLIRDAGYEPVSAGNLDSARAQEDAIGLWFALATAQGPVFYRFWKPGEL